MTTANEHRRDPAQAAAVKRLLLRSAARSHLWLCEQHGVGLRQAHRWLAESGSFEGRYSLQAIVRAVHELGQERAGGCR